MNVDVAFVVRVLIGALAVIQIWLPIRSVTTVLQPIRVSARKGLSYHFVFASIVAVSSLGEWIPHMWEQVPLLTGLSGGLVFVAVTSLIQWTTSNISALPKLWTWVDRVMAWVNMLSARPTPILLAVAVHGASPPVAVAACVLGVARTALTARNVYVHHSPAQRASEVLYAVAALPTVSSRERDAILRDWLRRAVLRRPGRPDLTLVLMLCEWAHATSQSRPWTQQSLEFRRNRLHVWRPLVEQLLNLVATEGVSRVHTSLRPKLEEALLSARYWYISTASKIFENADYREEAASALRELLTLAKGSGDQQAVVIAQSAVASYEGVRLGLVKESVATLESLLRREDLSVQTRFVVLLSTITVTAAKGDIDATERHVTELKTNIRSMSSRHCGPLAKIIRQQASVTIEAAWDLLSIQASPSSVQRGERTNHA